MILKTIAANKYCKNITDGTHDSPKPEQEGFYLITSKHLSRYSIDFQAANKISYGDYKKVIDRSKVEQFDILFSMIGTIGTIYQEMSPSENIKYAVKNMAIFKCGEYYKSKWLFYYLQSPKVKKYLYENLKGSTQKYIPLELLRKMPIDYCDDSSMRKIVQILSLLDDKIKNNIYHIDVLYNVLNTIYKNQFISINDSIHEKNFHHNNWIYSNVFDQIKEIKIKNKYENNYPVLSVVKEGEFKASEDIFTKQVHSKSTKNYKIVHRNQVVYNPARANIGSIAMLKEYDVGLVSPIYTVFEMKDTITPTFFYYYMKQPLFLKMIKHHAIGTTRQNFPFEAFKMFPMVVPPMELQLKFEEIAKPIERKITKLKEENETLAEIRDTLIPKLMSGELPVEVGEN
ncbi:restriction endonuclease subunit S [Fusobacterium mortiferum]|jgi:type I restriction enzyme S subunit|uniref:restriction endonuclease subunit S n=1 Tax=Fusobacterium mortiferum TaxID=850 RepID=UPI000E4A949D|nr:restriction endonuclease subunit S [Fusobacterium mortiferum]RHF68993.1 restriction endonuclease subunit S [Fusobacterium mortiferum]